MFGLHDLMLLNFILVVLIVSCLGGVQNPPGKLVSWTKDRRYDQISRDQSGSHPWLDINASLSSSYCIGFNRLFSHLLDNNHASGTTMSGQRSNVMLTSIAMCTPSD